jgi:hypothetical protein
MKPRDYFDFYLVNNSTLAEIIETLRYTYIFGERCIGRVIREMKARRLQDGER